ncbi:hypothetical protein CLOM_g21266 [Closterium sp. NIES-68]|nr:hypothetical protein CLOM_g21266 [Closterium sp. NIES-68]GJP68476.1 hypothetical protein CLOP_g25180 [Closterium sp. NIES-67]
MVACTTSVLALHPAPCAATFGFSTRLPAAALCSAQPSRQCASSQPLVSPRAGPAQPGFEGSRVQAWQPVSGSRRVVAAHARRKRKNPQPDKLMDGVEQLVDEQDIERVAASPQPSADDVAAGELSLDCNRFLIGRSMINDRVSDHEEGITWLRSAPRLLWVARERRAEADAADRQRRRE